MWSYSLKEENVGMYSARKVPPFLLLLPLLEILTPPLIYIEEQPAYFGVSC